MRILVVEDHEEARYMLEVLLQGYGHEVKSATDGIDALERASQEDFDMIISDVLMPRMDGFQFCREVKKNKRLKEIPFVFYTATYIEPSSKEFALSLGAERFIIKPAEPDVFMEIIKEVIKKHKMGILKAPQQPIEDETVYLKEYNERLIWKLEDKMLNLESVNKELKESEEKYRDWIENANDAVIFVNKAGKINFVNSKFCEVTGYSIDEAKGLHYLKLIHPESLDLCSEYFSKRLAGEKVPGNYDIKILTKTGQKVYIDNNVSIIEKKGKIIGILAIMRDITARKLAELANKQADEEKSKLQAQLLQAQKMEAIGTLTGGVAHDFNNLLMVIQGYVHLGLEAIDKKDPLYANMQKIDAAAESAVRLIRQLLLFSRKQSIEFVTLKINNVSDALLKMANRIIGADIAIKTDLAPGLWKVRGDVGCIEQVIMNLAVNAKDAMPEGGKFMIKTENVILDKDYCEIVSEARPGRFICLSFKDTGCGMDKDTLQHIFEPFFTTKKLGKGTGLGLSVVYGIVKQHQGWIEVTSELEKGSTFKVYLPAVFKEPDKKTKEKMIPEQEFQGKGERILLVEDDEGVREFSKILFQRNGYHVFEAENAKAALSIFEKEKGDFHLIFTDMVLPDRSGLELVEQLILRKPDLRVLLTSGYTNEKIQWSIIRERGYRFVQKPYNVSELLRIVGKMLI